MNSGSRFALSSAGLVLAMLVALEASVVAKPAPRGIDPGSVDRTLKADRLNGASKAAPQQQQFEPKLPNGCVSASDWQRKTIFTAEIAGRCVV